MPRWRRDLEHAQTQVAIAARDRRDDPAAAPAVLVLPGRPRRRRLVGRAGGRPAAATSPCSTTSTAATGSGRASTRSCATPRPRAAPGAIVLMHDAGGDRSQTVAALDRLHPDAQGRRATASPRSPRPATATRRPPPVCGCADGCALDAGAVQVADATMLAALGAAARRRRADAGPYPRAVRLSRSGTPGGGGRRRGRGGHRWSSRSRSSSRPTTSGRRSRRPSARWRSRPTAASRWSSSTTARPTAPRDVVAALGLANVRLVRVPPGGKSTALNTGMALASHDLIVMVDADTVVEPDSIHRLVQPFADPAVGAVAGNVKVGNRRGMHRPLAAHRVRHRLQPRPAALRHAAVACRPSRAPSARSAARPSTRPAGCRTTRSPRTPTSRWRCTGPAGGWCTRSPRARSPRRRRPSRSCGSSATGGATARCRRSGSTGTRWSRVDRPAGSAAGACR